MSRERRVNCQVHADKDANHVLIVVQSAVRSRLESVGDW